MARKHTCRAAGCTPGEILPHVSRGVEVPEHAPVRTESPDDLLGHEKGVTEGSQEAADAPIFVRQRFFYHLYAPHGEERIERLDVVLAIPRRHRVDLAAAEQSPHPPDIRQVRQRHVAGRHVDVLARRAPQGSEDAPKGTGAFHDVFDDDEARVRVEIRPAGHDDDFAKQPLQPAGNRLRQGRSLARQQLLVEPCPRAFPPAQDHRGVRGPHLTAPPLHVSGAPLPRQVRASRRSCVVRCLAYW